MKKGLVAAVLAFVAGAGTASAQGQPYPASGPIMAEQSPVIPHDSYDGAGRHSPRGWVSAEYLNWWITKGPVGVPLVTTGDAASPTGGAIGDPSTRVLFGNSGINYGTLYGGRVSMGYWFGCNALFGVEGSGFGFAQRSTTFSAASDPRGNPLLAFPFQTGTGVQDRRLISTPLPLAAPRTGSVSISSNSRLWGADFNGVANICRTCNLSIDLLAGFRYYDLQESLGIDTNSAITVIIPQRVINDQTVPAQTIAAALGSFDTFTTRNQFYGAQVGSRASYQAGRFSANVLGLIALGSTQHTTSIGGASNATINGAAIPAGPGGIYTRPSNIGNFHSSSFSVVPQVQVKLGYNITNNIRATIGYDALYWTNVNRPGNQIDSVIGPQPGNRPAPLDNHSNLWAHGVSTGLEFRW